VLLSITAAAVLGAADEPPAFKPGVASDYPRVQTIGKLKLAAVRYESDADCKSAFGKVNPNEYGILPVLFLLENQGDDTLLLDRMLVLYQVPGGSELESVPAKELPYVLGPKRPSSGPSYPMPIPLPKRKHPLTALELDQRSFAAKTLLAKDATNGFFYFLTRYNRNSILYVRGIRQASTRQEIFFAEIPLDTPDSKGQK
jgi:hypothetical protein